MKKNNVAFTVFLIYLLVVFTANFTIRHVHADGVLGWNGIGADDHPVPANWLWTYGCTADATGNITEIIAYCGKQTAGSCLAHAFIFSDNGTGEHGGPLNLLGSSSFVTLYNSYSWVTFPLSTPVNVTIGTRYHLGIQSGNSSSHLVRGESWPYFDDFFTTNAGSGFPIITDPWPWYGQSMNRLSIYAVIETEYTVQPVSTSYDIYTSGTFNVWLSTNHNFRVSANGVIVEFIADSNWNGTNCVLNVDRNSGLFRFTPENDTQIRIRYSGVATVKVNETGIANNTLLTYTGDAVQTVTWYFTITPWLPIMFIFGMIGIVSTFFGGLKLVYELQKKHYYKGFITSTIAIAIGISFVLAWLWT